jgi:hypothetical protein
MRQALKHRARRRAAAKRPPARTPSPRILHDAGAAAAVAAVGLRAVPRIRARQVRQLKFGLQQLRDAIDRREASGPLRRQACIRTAHRTQVTDPIIAGGFKHP